MPSPRFDLDDLLANLPISYGYQPVQGKRPKHIDESAYDVTLGQEVGRKVVQSGLGEGPWDGLDRWYADAFEINPADYTFHPGTADDAPDAFFPTDEARPWTSYIAGRLPRGMTDEQSRRVFGVYRTLRTANFDQQGRQLSAAGGILGSSLDPLDLNQLFFKPNPANSSADLVLRWGQQPRTLINWPAWCDWRDFNDEQIPWDDASRTPRSLSLTGTGGGAMTPGHTYEVRVAAMVGAEQSSASRQSASIAASSIVLAAGQTALQAAWLMKGDEETPVVAPVGVTGYRVYWRNATTNQAWRYVAVAGAGLRAHTVTDAGAIVADPLDTATAGLLRLVPRFECGLFFVPPFGLAEALDRICQISCADWQWSGLGSGTYRNDKLRFMTPAAREPVFTLDATKIGPGSFRTWAVDARSRPNQVVVNYRDRDDPYLAPGEPVILTRDLLVAAEKQTKTLTIEMGTCYRSQAQRTASYYAHSICDAGQMVAIKVSPQTYTVLPGDPVLVTDDTPGWTDQQFLIVKKGEKVEAGLGDSLIGRLYHPDAYSDSNWEALPSRLPARRTNPLAAPPHVLSTTLGERNILQPDGSVLSIIDVATAVDTTFTGTQRVRVYYKKSTDADALYRVAGIIDPEPTTGIGVLPIRGVEQVTYHVKAVAESAFASAGLASATQHAIPVTGRLAVPDAVSDLTHTVSADESTVTFSCTIPASVTDFSFLRIYDALENVVRDTWPGNTWQEPIPADGSNLARKVKVFNRSRVASAFSNTSTTAFASPTIPPSSSASAVKGSIILKWASLPNHTYEVSTTLAEDGSGVIATVADGNYTVTKAILRANGSTTYTYYVRAVRFNRRSAFIAIPFVYVRPNPPVIKGRRTAGGDKGAKLEFTPPSVTSGAIDGYEVRNNAGVTEHYVKAADAPSYDFTPPPGKADAKGLYVYTVDEHGVDSASSAADTTPPPATAPPSGFTAAFDGAEIVARWNAAGLTWQNLTGFAADADNNLTGGGSGSGATSVEALSGDGRARFVVTETTTRTYGLTTAASVTASANINFGFHIIAGALYRWDSSAGAVSLGVAVAAAAVLEVAVEDGKVVLYQNGTLRYTFGNTLTFPLRAGIHVASAAQTVAGAALDDGATIEFELARDAAFLTGPHRTRARSHRTPPHVLTTRAHTRYLRAWRNGVASASVSAAVTGTTAPAAPTLAQDTARANNFELPVKISTSMDRSLVHYTLLQVRAAGGAWPADQSGSTSGNFRFAGAPSVVVVPYAAGGTAEYRVAFEDAFTRALAAPDHQWSATGSYAFPRLLDSSIDPGANFLAKANYRNAIYRGGGVIEWTTGYTVRWSQPIIFSVAGIAGAATEVTLAAEAAGLTLAAGQAVIYRHVLGSSTATAVVVTLASYVREPETSTTTEFELFRRNADGSLGNYLQMPLLPGEIMDAAVVIPMSVQYVARIGTAIVNRVASNIYTPHGAQTAQTEFVRLQNPSGGTIDGLTGVFTQTAAAGADQSGEAFGTRVVASGAFTLLHTITEAITSTVNTFLGFNYGDDAGSLFSEADFAFRWHGTPYGGAERLEVFEGGTQRYTAANNWLPGDQIEIAYNGASAITYTRIRAGVRLTVYTNNAAAPKFPLRVYLSTYPLAYSFDPSATKLTALQADLNTEALRWTNRVNVTLQSDGRLKKISGGASTEDAGAASVQRLDGDFILEMTAHASTVANEPALCLEPSQTVPLAAASADYGLHFSSDGNLYKIVAGTYSTLGAAYTTGTVASLSREGGYIVWRKDGVQLFKTAAVVATKFYAVANFIDLNGVMPKPRLRVVGAMGQGLNLDGAAGTGEFGGGLKARGYDFNELTGRAAEAVNSNRQFRGNDYGPPEEAYITAASVADWDAGEGDDGMVRVWLKVTTPAPGDDEAANFDSVRWVRVRVYDRTGKLVKEIQRMPFAPGADAMIPSFSHPRRYADPGIMGDAKYELSFRNVDGWSRPVYLSGNAANPALGYARGGQALSASKSFAYEISARCAYGYGTTPPSLEVRRYGLTIPLTMTPVGGGRTISLVSAAPLAASYNLASPTILALADKLYDIHYQSNNYKGSNVVRVRTPPAVTDGLTYHAPSGLRGTRASGGVTLDWTLPIGTATGFRVYKNGVDVSGLLGVVFTYTHAVAPATGDEFLVVAVYAGGTSGASNGFITPELAASSSASPDSLSAFVVSSSRIDYTWAINSAAGAVTFYWRARGAASYTAVALAALTQSYSLTGLSADTEYDTYVAVADAGSVPTPAVYERTMPAMSAYY